MTVSQITERERKKLERWIRLGRAAKRQLDDVIDAACDITGDDQYGHTGDAVYGACDVDELLEKLDIEVIGGTQDSQELAVWLERIASETDAEGYYKISDYSTRTILRKAAESLRNS